MKFIEQPINLIFATAALVSGALLVYTRLAGASGSRAISPLQTTQLINGSNAIVVDVRSAEEFAGGTITGARNVPEDGLAAKLADLARFKNRPVILVCSAGQRSMKAVKSFADAGFTEVYNLAGGLGAWREAGLPLIKSAGKEGGAGGKKEKS